MALLDSRMSQNLVIITDSGLQVGPQALLYSHFGVVLKSPESPCATDKVFSETSDFHPFSSCLIYSKSLLQGTLDNWDAQDVSSGSGSSSLSGILGRISKTYPEKLASCEKSEGPSMILSSQWLLTGLLMSLFGVLDLGWAFSVAILLKCTSL